ncbi:conserved exported protein of unknown function [Cupriavidus taiwanensis]|nr:conserved exported protein of unknown function [Cupriavidus taiwanensis]
MLTVLPASALPESVGVVSLVLPPATIAVPASLLAALIAGAAGAAPSTVTVAGGLVLPEPSVAVTLTTVPSASGCAGV